MINFSFGLSVPSAKDTMLNKILFSSGSKVSTNKAYELNVYYRGWRQLFHIHFDFTPTGRSHAGLFTSFCLLGLELEFEFHDVRHWNYDACRYATPDEADEW